MRKHGVIHVLTQEKQDLDTDTAAQICKFNTNYRKALPNIVLNLGEEPAVLGLSLLLHDDRTKEHWKKLTNSYQKENRQSKSYLHTRLQNVSFNNDGNLKEH